MENPRSLETLILKNLQGIASQEEKAELETWLRADPSHSVEFKAFLRIWEDSLPVLQSHQFDYQAAWDRIRPSLLAENTSQTPAPQHFGTHSVSQSAVRRIFSLTPGKWIAAASLLLIAGSAGWWFFSGKKARPVEVIAQTGNRRISLPDGSTIILRQGSSVRYPETFSGDQRHISLSGEAYFEVRHDPASPFLVETALALIQDIGTAFLVRDRDSAEEVIVSDGRVRIASRSHAGKDITLGAGEMAVLGKKEVRRSQASDSNYLAWKTGTLNFHNTPLTDAMKDINNFYGIELVLGEGLSQAGAADSILINAHFKDQPLQEVLEELRLMTGLQMKRQRDTFVLFR